MGSRDRCNWIRTRVETPLWLTYSKEKKMHIFERLAFADNFERFLGNKYNTAKRFGLDGGESVIPGKHNVVGVPTPSMSDWWWWFSLVTCRCRSEGDD